MEPYTSTGVVGVYRQIGSAEAVPRAREQRQLSLTSSPDSSQQRRGPRACSTLKWNPAPKQCTHLSIYHPGYIEKRGYWIQYLRLLAAVTSDGGQRRQTGARQEQRRNRHNHSDQGQLVSTSMRGSKPQTLSFALYKGPWSSMLLTRNPERMAKAVYTNGHRDSAVMTEGSGSCRNTHLDIFQGSPFVTTRAFTISPRDIVWAGGLGDRSSRG
mmetsp:Transcript_23064/g.41544  ORF Transcript_23064/g.41544 Transcript_23064/m.41544 type:complete len:213 (-) Transcript_23064:655-1293(-)